jgi:ubiquinone/menaquinone biosynthesis C-methylase UbiE
LDRKIKEKNLTNRVRIMKCSLDDMLFDEESFDIIWAEGSIYFIGFDRGIKEWGRFLKKNGFMIVHDELTDYMTKIKAIEASNYSLHAFFMLSSSVWWNEY